MRGHFKRHERNFVAGHGAAAHGRPHHLFAQRVRLDHPVVRWASSASLASRPLLFRKLIRRPGTARTQAQHQAAVCRIADQSIDRGVRYPLPRCDCQGGRRLACGRQTAFVLRPCSGPRNMAPTSSCIRAPSTLMARAAWWRRALVC